MVAVGAGEVTGGVAAELHQVEPRADDEGAGGGVLLLDHDVRHEMARPPHRRLRPGARVGDALGADGHQIAVLVEDRGHALAGRLLGLCRHPIDSVRGEEIDEIQPAALVEDLGLAVKKLLDFAQRPAADLGERRRRAAHRASPIHSAQARNWFRIGASLVPCRDVTTPSTSSSWPALRWKLTQSPPSDDRPWWQRQKFSRSSALISVAGELTRL